MEPDNLGWRLFVLEDIGTEAEIVSAIADALRAGNLDAADRNLIANMLDPKGRGRFQLKVSRRRGNRGQDSDGRLNRIERVGEIYEDLVRSGMSEVEATTETVKLASMPVSEGGVGKSDTTVRDYLRGYHGLQKAQQEAREAE